MSEKTPLLELKKLKKYFPVRRGVSLFLRGFPPQVQRSRTGIAVPACRG